MSDKSNPTIQEKMEQLDTLIAWFDGDEFQLEAAFDQFKQAEALAREIETELDTMKNDIHVLKQRFDNEN